MTRIPLMSRPGRWLLPLLLTVAPVAGTGCESIPPANYPTVAPDDPGNVPLGALDKIAVTIFGGGTQPIRTDYTLDAAGIISMPYIGEVTAVGQTPSALRDQIQAALRDGYLLRAIVSVDVTEINSRRVSISGEIQKDSSVRFEQGMTIVDAIAQGGGFTPMAKKNAVNVTRVVEGQEVTYTIPVEAIQKGKRPNFPMAAGDRVFVPTRLL